MDCMGGDEREELVAVLLFPQGGDVGMCAVMRTGSPWGPQSITCPSHMIQLTEPSEWT